MNTIRAIVVSSIVGGVVLLTVGAGGGYYYARYHSLDVEYSYLCVQPMLKDAKWSLTMMSAIANGKIDNAYIMSEGSVVAGVTIAREYPGLTDAGRRATEEFLARVKAFYKEHPDRRAETAARYAKLPDLLEFLDPAN
jgi:hypothetical protein